MGREYLPGNIPTGFPSFCHLHSACAPMFRTRQDRVALEPGSTSTEDGWTENSCRREKTPEKCGEFNVKCIEIDKEIFRYSVKQVNCAC